MFEDYCPASVVPDTIKGQYMYDANGLRILKIEDSKTTIYIYSGQTLLFEETYNTENPSQLVAANRTLRELNIVAGSMNLAKYKWIPAIGWGQANAILHYHLLDHLGSRQVTTDVNGNTITDGNTEYATFGNKTAGAASETSFTGKKFDTGIGLYYFNARYYDSITGRFITQDPIKDGTNWYVYCGNNPVSRFDKNGREFFCLFGDNTIAGELGGFFQFASQAAKAGTLTSVSTGTSGLAMGEWAAEFWAFITQILCNADKITIPNIFESRSDGKINETKENNDEEKNADGSSKASKGKPKPPNQFKSLTNRPQLPPNPNEIPPGWKVRIDPPDDIYPNGHWHLTGC